MSKKIDECWDRFKGDYKSKPKDNKKIIDDYINELYYSVHTGLYYPGRYVTINPPPDLVGHNVKSVIIDEPVCFHEYVDVGFMTPKHVCKHCDKEKENGTIYENG